MVGGEKTVGGGEGFPRQVKKEVTAAEIDQEIDNVAMRFGGISREAWLRTLDQERGISPVQYARDIIYPALALRKLAADRVQVSKEDLKNAFEAQYVRSETGIGAAEALAH